MNENNIFFEKAWITIVVWRILLFLILIIAVVSNIFLMNNNYLNGSIYLLSISSFVVAYIVANIFRFKELAVKYKQLQANVNEAQKIIHQSGFGIFKYGKISNINNLNFSLIEIVIEPLAWCLCIALFFCFFLTPPYLDFDDASLRKVIEFIFMTLLQVGMLSFAILGIGIVVNKKLRNKEND